MIVTGVHAQTDRENNGGETESEVGGFHGALGGIGFLMVLATLAAGFLVSTALDVLQALSLCQPQTSSS